MGGVVGKGSASESAFEGEISATVSAKAANVLVGGIVGEGEADASSFDGNITISADADAYCGAICGLVVSVKDSEAAGTITMNGFETSTSYGGTIAGKLVGNALDIIKDTTSTATVVCKETEGSVGLTVVVE